MENDKIKVLQCVANFNRAGVETVIMNYYRNIDRNKFQFDFLCNKEKKGAYIEEIKSYGGKIFFTPCLNPMKWPQYQDFMNDFFSKHKEYKIIHCQNEEMAFPALYAAKKNGVPVRIAHAHNTATRFDIKWPIKTLYKYLIRTVATDYIACGHAAGKWFFGKDVKVLNNAIDIDKFKYNQEVRNKLRKELHLEDKYVIGHVGRIDPQKNHIFLLKVFREYLKIDKSAVLLLIGSGTLEKKIKEKVKKMGIENNVIFTGNIPNVNEMYNVMDVFVLPSLYEGLPLVGIEAQCSGLPCIFSDRITDEVLLNSNVCSIPINNNYDEWCKKIAQYKHENRVYEYHKEYDIKYVKKELEDYYIDLLNKRVIGQKEI